MAMHAIHSMYKSAAEMVIPTRKQSAFRDKGVLTPDEFVQAGDEVIRSVQLCSTFQKLFCLDSSLLSF